MYIKATAAELINLGALSVSLADRNEMIRIAVDMYIESFNKGLCEQWEWMAMGNRVRQQLYKELSDELHKEWIAKLNHDLSKFIEKRKG